MSERKSPADTFKTPLDIFEMVFAVQKGRALLTAYELGVFSALGDGEKTSGEVAQAIAADPRSTDRLMNAICAIGLLEKRDGLFSNTPFAANFLVKGKPGYITALQHSVHLWDTWTTLTAAVREGKTVVAGHIDGRGDEWLTAFIAAMHYRAYATAPGVVGLLDLSGVARVLDLGGGSAAYSMAFVRAKEGITSTVFDLPNVVPLTRQYIESEGLSDRIDVVVGDFNEDELPAGYDMVFLSAIIHSNSFEQSRELIKKAAGALNPGGQVVVQDFIMDEDRTGPPFGALFALNMLVGTECGDTYTESETAGWMKDAGLRDIERKDTKFRTALIVGRKK